MKTWKMIPLIVSLALRAAFVSCFMLCWWFKRKGNKSNMESQSENQFLEISYHALLRATDGFSPSNLIGTRGFGSVYKGVLDAGMTLVAVKVFNLLQHGASKRFVAECNVLRNVRHRNLVKILTACSSIDNRGGDWFMNS